MSRGKRKRPGPEGFQIRYGGGGPDVVVPLVEDYLKTLEHAVTLMKSDQEHIQAMGHHLLEKAAQALAEYHLMRMDRAGGIGKAVKATKGKTRDGACKQDRDKRIRAAAADGQSGVQIAERFGLSESTISRILSSG